MQIATVTKPIKIAITRTSSVRTVVYEHVALQFTMALFTMNGCWLALLVFCLLLVISFQQDVIIVNQPLPTSQPSCLPLDPKLVPLCAGMPYNQTSLPNSRGHTSLLEASAELKDFEPVIHSNCSSAIVHFLCSVYTPPCYDSDLAVKVVQPCRQLCVEVRDKCEGIYRQASLQWPQHLSCDHYPDRNDKSSVCFGPEDSSYLTIPKIEPQSDVLNTKKTPNFSVSPSPAPSTSQECRNSLQEVPMCRELGYHNFSLPNLRGHQKPSQATKELSLFKLFVDMKCSQSIAHFLCYYYAPPCSTTSSDSPPPPCRELCEHSRQQCTPILQKLDITWPSHMNCERFPYRNSSSQCSGPADVNTLRIPNIITASPSPEPNSAQKAILESTAITVTLVMSIVTILLYT